ncbi:metal ABC transporter ATP-binding protein [Pseudodesulfovibrio senegalensis]|jgi:zinc transport system ATP-binding protein|uniref:metal ABC transporter ATP-binding protein n=1 Tax=Pseudodesulfovibrio senegalensis TaxID=1721087 RepID=UPI001478F0B4|nr:ABC transporter ATP-binding protein [Pseudodesulfovibrio senegalensis]
MVADHVVSLQDVTFAYNGTPVLEHVNLEIERGDFVAVLGPNGGGKSTLIKLLLGLISPQQGTVHVLGCSPGECGDRIGYMPQYTNVSGSFPITVLDVVSMGVVRSGFAGVAGLRPGRDAMRKALGALERVGLETSAGRCIAELSGGQRQRVFIARAIVSDPDLLLLDEPTASVDQENRVSLFGLLRELNRNMTIIMVSHDISTIAKSVKSVACVNRTLHFHNAPLITGEMFKMAYGEEGGCCPVELVAHGDIPHRVLEHHHTEDND